jgi:hypothetical protein
MITLSTLILLYGIISTYRTYRKCKKENTPFDPFKAHSFLEFLGVIVFFVSSILMIGFIAALMIKYLP